LPNIKSASFISIKLFPPSFSEVPHFALLAYRRLKRQLKVLEQSKRDR
jgi:hypothetical protein